MEFDNSAEIVEAFITNLQSAYWRLDYKSFCEVTGFTPDTEYSAIKFSQFQQMCKSLAKFDIDLLRLLAR